MENACFQMLAAFAGSLGFGLLFRVHGRKLWAAAVGGMLTWGVCLLAQNLLPSLFAPFLLASIFAAFLAEGMARVLRAPVTVFLVPAVIPMIPGGSLYETMRCAVAQDYEAFARTGMNTLSLSAAIAVGILLASSAVTLAQGIARALHTR